MHNKLSYLALYDETARSKTGFACRAILLAFSSSRTLSRRVFNTTTLRNLTKPISGRSFHASGRLNSSLANRRATGLMLVCNVVILRWTPKFRQPAEVDPA